MILFIKPKINSKLERVDVKILPVYGRMSSNDSRSQWWGERVSTNAIMDPEALLYNHDSLLVIHLVFHVDYYYQWTAPQAIGLVLHAWLTWIRVKNRHKQVSDVDEKKSLSAVGNSPGLLTVVNVSFGTVVISVSVEWMICLVFN